MSGPPSPQELLRRHGLRPKRAWGQNFLREAWVLGGIRDALMPQPGERVVELGAGLGHLTAALAESGAQVLAVERDRDLVPILKELFAGAANVTILEADAKQVDLEALREGGPRVAVAGNLPYHLTSPILFRILEQRAHVSRAVLMMQKEVAERLAAGPGGKDFGSLSVQFQLQARVQVVFDVSPAAFVPQPEVTSTVVRLDFRETPLADPGDPEVFRKTVRAAFAQRRKTIMNGLKSARLLSKDDLADALAEAGVEPTARAETVSVEAFAALSRAITARLGPDEA